jgi:hypothetical protein
MTTTTISILGNLIGSACLVAIVAKHHGVERKALAVLVAPFIVLSLGFVAWSRVVDRDSLARLAFTIIIVGQFVTAVIGLFLLPHWLRH